MCLWKIRQKQFWCNCFKVLLNFCSKSLKTTMSALSKIYIAVLVESYDSEWGNTLKKYFKYLLVPFWVTHVGHKLQYWDSLEVTFEFPLKFWRIEPCLYLRINRKVVIRKSVTIKEFFIVIGLNRFSSKKLLI